MTWRAYRPRWRRRIARAKPPRRRGAELFEGTLILGGGNFGKIWKMEIHSGTPIAELAVRALDEVARIAARSPLLVWVPLTARLAARAKGVVEPIPLRVVIPRETALRAALAFNQSLEIGGAVLFTELVAAAVEIWLTGPLPREDAMGRA